MMHKWESVPRLISEMEKQDIGDPFVYNDFSYRLDEFDNVPPVIPRFTFYLQLNLKPIIAYAKTLKDGQSVPELRTEALGLIEQAKRGTEACE